LFRLFPFILLGSCNHCNLVCFLLSIIFRSMANALNGMSRYMCNYMHGSGVLSRSCFLCTHSRTSQHIIGQEVSLPCSHKPSTCPYPDPDQSSLHHPILSCVHRPQSINLTKPMSVRGRLQRVPTTKVSKFNIK
jgi:hypothetical protein